MRKVYSFLLAFVAMLMLPGQAWSEVKMTFKYVNTNGEVIKDAMSYYSTPVSVYLQGEEVASTQYNRDDNWNFDGTWTMTFDDDALAGKTVSYETYFGQRGTFTVTEGETLTATLVMLTVTVKDTEGQPVSDAYVYIYTPDGNSNSYYTNNEGQFTKYYAAGTGFSWRWGDQSGTFDMTADYALNITKQATTTFNLRVKGRYGDYPVSTGSLYIYKYGDTDNQVASIYGSNSVKLDAGDYWVKDELGMFSEKFTVNKDMTYWLEYHKVTFKSMTGTTPNVDQQIRVYYDRDSWNYNNKRTDQKGEVSMYLRAGTYTYTVDNVDTEFTVGNADQTIAISTAKVTITLDCSATDLSDQTFRWGSVDGNSSNVKPDGKTIVISPVMPGKYQLRINDYNTIDFDVVAGENAKTVKLYALQFTTNIETTNSVYVNEGAFRMAFNKKYYLLSGDYSYGMSYYGDVLGTVNLTADTTVPLNYGILTVTVKDGNGIVKDERVSFGGYSRTTDENGQVKFTQLLEPTNQFTLSAPDCYVSKDITLAAGEQTAELIIPDYVSFNVTRLGQAYNINGLWIETADDQRLSYRLEVVEGATKARLDPTKTYSVGAYHGTTAITEGCTIALGVLTVTCDGMGIALPMENWDAASSYPVLVGTTVRLAAIPVYGVGFQKWDINDGAKSFTEGMVDLKITDPQTVATAEFGGTVPTKVSQYQANTSFNNDGRYVYLPENTDGTVRIYSMDGKLMKSLSVSGDQIGIYDLPTGAYVLTLSTNSGDTKVARFLKK